MTTYTAADDSLIRDDDGKVTFIKLKPRYRERLDHILERYGSDEAKVQSKLQILFLAMMANGETPKKVTGNVNDGQRTAKDVNNEQPVATGDANDEQQASTGDAPS